MTYGIMISGVSFVLSQVMAEGEGNSTQELEGGGEKSEVTIQLYFD